MRLGTFFDHRALLRHALSIDFEERTRERFRVYVYLGRYMRMSPGEVDGMTSLEVRTLLEELGEVIKSESAARHVTESAGG